MNHQERVMTGVNHVEPDRLPVDLGGMHSSGIMAMDYQELKEHLGISEGELLIPDAPQQLAYVEAPVRERFGVDVLPLDIGMVVGSRPYVLPNGVRARISASFLTEDDGSGGEFVVDAGGTRLKHRPASSFYFYPIYHPLQEAQTAADIDAYEWPILTDEELELLRREARRLRENEGRDYAVAS